MSRLESHLRAERANGRKLLVPYVTAMMDAEWIDLVRAFVAAGADAVEIGVPFSDPIMDGPTIQEASVLALERGATPMAIIDQLAAVDVAVPMIVMTYYNLAYRAGHERFAGALASAGIDGAILADLQMDEAADWIETADRAGVENILLAAPTTSDDRLGALCEATRGFIYGVSLVGVTGERTKLAHTATEMARRLKAVTDKPVLAGVGISNASQAVEVSVVADGVIMASALMRQRMSGASVDEVAATVHGVREALDRG